MKRLLQLLALNLLLLNLAVAQTASVKRNVNLRSKPSTASASLRMLKPPMPLKLLDAGPKGGFYHVEAADGQQGWVWGRNISLSSSGPQSTTGGSTSSEIASGWDKTAPQDAVFHGQEGDCGDTGDGGDADTNSRKNRVDIPSSYHSVAWDAVNNLAYPKGAPRSRMSWSSSQLAEIAPYEGVAISVEGFLVKIKVESGGESTNCHFKSAPDVDWHMPFTANAGQGDNVAVIVETTPRIRQQHSNWTVARLKPWTGTGQKVRISGWLLLDPEHQDMINHGQRSTLWEIHPITRIEVWKNGGWVDLDDLP